MDLSKQFSLTDFLAYFFPGVFAAVGLYLLIRLTPIQTALIPPDITTGIVFLTISAAGACFERPSCNLR